MLEAEKSGDDAEVTRDLDRAKGRIQSLFSRI